MSHNADYQIHKEGKEALDKAITVCKEVFKPGKDELALYYSKEDWAKRIENGLLLLAYDQEKIIGFAISYKTNDLTFHIWNVGVLEEYRGKGIWSGFFKQIAEHARLLGMNKLTLNTYKTKFPNMYQFVTSHNFNLIKTENVEVDGKTVEKNYFEYMLY
jgi:GNAT superfamily N-acetyltransferase